MTDKTHPKKPAEPPRKDSPEEFGRFEQLTRKLLKVPKSAVDDKRRNGA
jgi:hypothetical protein